MSRFALASAFALIGTFAPAAEWGTPSRHLGALRTDGALHEIIELGKIRTNDFDEAIVLAHELRIDWTGHGASSWRVPQLESWLVPTGYDEITFCCLGGAISKFKAAQIGEGMYCRASNGADARIQQSGADYEVKLPSGTRYLFHAGRLCEIRPTTGGVYEVSSAGGRVDSIKAAAGAVVLEAERDRFGRTTVLKLTSRTWTFFYDARGALARAESPEVPRRVIRFEYDRDLISRLQDDGQERRFRWRENPEPRLAGKRYVRAPWLIAEAGDGEYAYETSDGWTIMTWRRQGHVVGTMHVEWVTGRVVSP